MLRTLSLVLCLVAVSHPLQITKFSVPAATEKDGNAELSCSHDGAEKISIVKWFWSPAGPDSRLQIYQRLYGGKGAVVTLSAYPDFNVTLKAEDEDTLMLWAVQPEHSGTFECQVQEEKGDFQEIKKSSDMAVYTIGAGPQLTFDEGDDSEVLVTCAAAGVAPEPDIAIRYDSNTFNTTVVDGPYEGLYNVSTNATLKSQDIEGVEISCQLSFKDTDVITSDAMQVSDTYYSEAWLAPTTAAPDDTPEVQAALEANQTTTGSAGRSGGAWTLAALAILLHLRL